MLCFLGRDRRAKSDDPLESWKARYMAWCFYAARTDTAHVLLVVRARRGSDLRRGLRHSLKGGGFCERHCHQAAEVAGSHSRKLLQINVGPANAGPIAFSRHNRFGASIVFTKCGGPPGR